MAELEKRVADAEARAEAAEARVKELEEQLAKYEGKKTPPRDPGTPSGAIPPYEKPGSGNTNENKKRKKRKKPGRKKGHEGARRVTPDHVDRYENHPLDRCPDCGCADLKNRSTRTRYTGGIDPIAFLLRCLKNKFEHGQIPSIDYDKAA